MSDLAIGTYTSVNHTVTVTLWESAATGKDVVQQYPVLSPLISLRGNRVVGRSERFSADVHGAMTPLQAR